MTFCRKCGLPLRWYGTKWMHVLLSGRAIRVGHEPDVGDFAEIDRQPVTEPPTE